MTKGRRDIFRYCPRLSPGFCSYHSPEDVKFKRIREDQNQRFLSLFLNYVYSLRCDMFVFLILRQIFVAGGHSRPIIDRVPERWICDRDKIVNIISISKTYIYMGCKYCSCCVQAFQLLRSVKSAERAKQSCVQVERSECRQAIQLLARYVWQAEAPHRFSAQTASARVLRHSAIRSAENAFDPSKWLSSEMLRLVELAAKLLKSLLQRLTTATRVYVWCEERRRKEWLYVYKHELPILHAFCLSSMKMMYMWM